MSPKLPIVTPKQLVRAFQRAGFVIDHQRGSHLYMSHPDAPARLVPIPMHAKDVKKGTLANILRLAGISTDRLIELL